MKILNKVTKTILKYKKQQSTVNHQRQTPMAGLWGREPGAKSEGNHPGVEPSLRSVWKC